MAGTRDPFEYEVAVSYASEDRAAAQELVRLLEEKQITVFRDEYRAEDAGVWGKDISDHLVNLYARKARYCILLLSRHYPLKSWTESERSTLRELALRDAEEYILPILLDDQNVPGLKDIPGHWDLRQPSAQSIVEQIAEKLAEARERPAPPPASHDLRSGNVPSQE